MRVRSTGFSGENRRSVRHHQLLLRHVPAVPGDLQHHRPWACQPRQRRARELCARGATNPDLAGRLGVARSTIGQWIATHPEFAEAVQQGRDVADATAVESLFTRVTGYNHQAEKVFLYRGETRAVTYTVHVPAEIRACMFWLRNRRPEDWRERSERALAEHAQQEAADAALRAELHEAQERMRRFRAEDGL
jgi:hypothetical protein